MAIKKAEDVLETIRKQAFVHGEHQIKFTAVSYTHLRAHETVLDLVCRLLLEKKKQRLRRRHPNTTLYG